MNAALGLRAQKAGLPPSQCARRLFGTHVLDVGDLIYMPPDDTWYRVKTVSASVHAGIAAHVLALTCRAVL